MRMHLATPAQVAGNRLPAGEYEVGVDEERGQVTLAGAGGTLRVPATRRSAKMRVDKPSAQLRQIAGEPRRLLIVRTPPAIEWVVSLQDAT